MSGKVKRGELKAAREAAAPVCVHRTPKGADAIEGYVVGLGRRWVLIHRLNDFQFDGWVALRLDTVGRIEPRGADGVYSAGPRSPRFAS